MKKIGLVIQGALTSVGRTGDNMRQSVEQLKKEGGVIEYDCRENINRIIKEYGHLFDEIVVSVFDNQLKPGDSFPGAKLVSAPDPGGIKQAGHYKDNNKYRQFISTLNGLIELEKDGIDYAIKTRTDISLDFNKLIKDFFAKDRNPNTIGATVIHPKTFLLHDLYFMSTLPVLKKFCEAIIAYDKFEFIPSVHREMLLKHAYVEYREAINVPDYAYFPVYPPTGVNAETRKIFDYMFENVYFSLDPQIFKDTLWRGTYFPEDHIASLTKGNPSSRKYNIPALISTDWKRYFHFRQEFLDKPISPIDKVVIKIGEWGSQSWNLFRKMVR
ncbi:MAG: hypothetical protein AAB758_01025, partial [Patescibacteria group bacterium]